ncbi:hypothetical protein FHX11_001571 [Rhizobium sp. BK602]|nr:hypothetical protein [Rhizobium sp. BK602]
MLDRAGAKWRSQLTNCAGKTMRAGHGQGPTRLIGDAGCGGSRQWKGSGSFSSLRDMCEGGVANTIKEAGLELLDPLYTLQMMIFGGNETVGHRLDPFDYGRIRKYHADLVALIVPRMRNPERCGAGPKCEFPLISPIPELHARKLAQQAIFCQSKVWRYAPFTFLALAATFRHH